MSKPVNTGTREGAAIAELYTAIQRDAVDGEDWNGGDVVDLLTQWFDALGFDMSKGWEDQ